MTSSPLASTLDNFFGIMVSTGNVYRYIAVDIVAPIAIMLCFIFIIARFAYNTWQGGENGLEKAKAVAKENWVRFFFLIMICIPLQGATMNLNFLGAWPWFIAKAGIDFGDKVANNLPVYNADWGGMVADGSFVDNVGACGLTSIPAGSSSDLVGLSKTLALQSLFTQNTNGILGVANNAVKAVDSIINRYQPLAEKYEQCLETAKTTNSNFLDKILHALGADAIPNLLNYISTLIKYLPIILILGLLLSLVGATAFLIPFVNALALGATAATAAGISGVVTTVLAAIGLIVARILSGSIFVYALTFAFFGVLIQWLAEVCIYAVSFPFSAVNLAFGEGQKQAFIRHFAKGIQLMLVPALASVIFATALILFGTIMMDGGLLSKMGDVFIGDPSTASGLTDIIGLALRWIIFGLFAPFIIVVPLAKTMFGTFSVAESIVGGSVQLVQSAVGGLGQTR
ncbi:MAG: hypothetical protein M0Z67_04250 [Nitrospiraceae bacterium]|nr:hypothetical protein [Nitrospiraceae bacterium]